MVNAMMRRPPQRAALQRAAPQPRQDELHDPRGLIGAMSEIAMVAARDAEHFDEIGGGQKDDGEDADAGEQGGKADNMQQR